MTDIPDFDEYCEQYPSIVTFEPLAQTWHVKMWRWKPNSIKCESNFIDTSRRTRAGLNPETGTDQLSLYYIVFLLRGGNRKLLWTYDALFWTLDGENGTDGSPCGFFHQHRQNRLASITESSVFSRLGWVRTAMLGFVPQPNLRKTSI